MLARRRCTDGSAGVDMGGRKATDLSPTSWLISRVAATLSVLGLRVKAQDLVVSMTASLYCVVTSLGAFSWSPGSLVLAGVFGSKLDAS
jgi:hypothetical protein